METWTEVGVETWVETTEEVGTVDDVMREGAVGGTVVGARLIVSKEGEGSEGREELRGWKG